MAKLLHTEITPNGNGEYLTLLNCNNLKIIKDTVIVNDIENNRIKLTKNENSSFLHIGGNTEIGGILKIVDSESSSKFQVDTSGNTTIGGKLKIEDKTEASASDGAIIVTGGIKSNGYYNSGAIYNEGCITIASTADIDISKDISSYTPSLKTSGGVYIAGQLKTGKDTTIGGALEVTGVTRFRNAKDASSTTDAGTVVLSGLGVAKQLRVGGVATFSNAKDASSTKDAGVVVLGGLGVDKKLIVGGVATFSNAKDASSTTEAGTIVKGGLGVAKQLRVGGAISAISEKSTLHSLDVNNATILKSTLDVTDNTTIGGTLTVKGETILEGNVRLGDATTDTTVIGGTLKVNNTTELLKTTISGDLILNGDTTINNKSITIKDSNNIPRIILNNKGEISASLFNVSSDERKKKNIKKYETNKSILDLEVKEFDYKDSDIHTIGCIAQDLQKLFPEFVVEDADGYLSIQEIKLIYPLLLEVKKLREEINVLKNKLEV